MPSRCSARSSDCNGPYPCTAPVVRNRPAPDRGGGALEPRGREESRIPTKRLFFSLSGRRSIEPAAAGCGRAAVPEKTGAATDTGAHSGDRENQEGRGKNRGEERKSGKTERAGTAARSGENRDSGNGLQRLRRMKISFPRGSAHCGANGRTTGIGHIFPHIDGTIFDKRRKKRDGRQNISPQGALYGKATVQEKICR